MRPVKASQLDASSVPRRASVTLLLCNQISADEFMQLNGYTE